MESFLRIVKTTVAVALGLVIACALVMYSSWKWASGRDARHDKRNQKIFSQVEDKLHVFQIRVFSPENTNGDFPGRVSGRLRNSSDKTVIMVHLKLDFKRDYPLEKSPLMHVVYVRTFVRVHPNDVGYFEHPFDWRGIPDGFTFDCKLTGATFDPTLSSSSPP